MEVPKTVEGDDGDDDEDEVFEPVSNKKPEEEDHTYEEVGNLAVRSSSHLTRY